MSTIVDVSEVLLQMGLADNPSDLQRAICGQALTAANSAVIQRLGYDPKFAERTEYYPQDDFRRSGSLGIWEVSDTQAYVRQLSQYVTNELQVKHIPIRGDIIFLSIDYDGRFGTRAGSFPTPLILGTDYFPQYESTDSSNARVCSDGIIRSFGRWPDLPGSVKITYNAGYTDDELHGQDPVLDASPIAEAVVDETVRRVHKIFARMKKRLGIVGPFTSEGMGDYNYSINTEAINRLISGTMDLLPETEQKLSKFIRMDFGGVM